MTLRFERSASGAQLVALTEQLEDQAGLFSRPGRPGVSVRHPRTTDSMDDSNLMPSLRIVRERELESRHPRISQMAGRTATQAELNAYLLSHIPKLGQQIEVGISELNVECNRKDTFIRLVPTVVSTAVLLEERAKLRRTLDRFAANRDAATTEDENWKPQRKWGNMVDPDITIGYVPLGLKSPNTVRLTEIYNIAHDAFNDNAPDGSPNQPYTITLEPAIVSPD